MSLFFRLALVSVTGWSVKTSQEQENDGLLFVFFLIEPQTLQKIL